MSSREIVRQWFIPGDGIDRTVISTDIQRYLGNDATVRPGTGTNENEGVPGYWIKAYRNLTSAMISDLRADSQRWRQEQRATGTREPYEGSSTYNASSAAKITANRAGDSPRSQEYGVAAPRERERERERERPPPSRMMDHMDMDPPVQSSRIYAPERAYPVSGTGFPPANSTRVSNFPGNEYPPEQTSYSRAPVNGTPYVGAQAYQQAPASHNDGPPPGFVRQGNYLVPVPAYETTGSSMQSRSELPNGYGAGYGQPPAPAHNEPRSYGQQPDYNSDASRFAYPSPAVTVSSVTAREREPVMSSQQASYGHPVGGPGYDQYGRPAAKHSSAGARQPEPFMQPTRESREPSTAYRRGGPPQPPVSGGDHRRRRLA